MTTRRAVQLRQRTRVPVVYQQAKTECGLACIAMIIRRLGDARSLGTLRRIAPVGRDGLSAQGMMQTARLLGYSATAVSADLDGARRFHGPTIIHWGFTHYVILERWDGTRARIVDPSSGRRTVSAREFSDRFTGVAVLVTKDVSHVAHPQQRDEAQTADGRASLSSTVRSVVRDLRWPAVRSIACSFLVQLLPLGSAFAIAHLIGLPQTDVTLNYTWVALVLVQLAVATFCVALARSVAVAAFSARLQSALTRRVIQRLLDTEYVYLRSRPAGDLIDRVSGVHAIQGVISSVLIGSTLDVMALLLYAAILTFVAPPIGLGMIVVLLLYFGVLWVLSSLLASRAFVAAQAAGAQKSFGVQVLSASESIKNFRAEGTTVEQWMQRVDVEAEASYRFSLYQGILTSFAVAVQWGVPLTAVAVGISLVQSGELALGTLVGIQTLLGSMLASGTALAYTLQQLYSAKASFSRVADVFEASSDLSQAMALPGRAEFRSTLTLDDVGFCYEGSSVFAVRGVSAVVRPGEMLAITGKTGAGKSTLLRILLGLERPTQGCVSFDGVPSSDLDPHEVRALFGVVSQDPQIMSGSVRDALSIGGRVATDDDCWAALAVAELRNEIEATPMGLDTTLGDHGEGLSGGQRQRLAIARAALGHPRLLVLDEATAALDEDTESRIFRNLRNSNITMIVVSHRPSVYNAADQTLDLDSLPAETSHAAQGPLTKRRGPRHSYATQLASPE